MHPKSAPETHSKTDSCNIDLRWGTGLDLLRVPRIWPHFGCKIVGVGDRPGSPSGAKDSGVVMLMQNSEETNNAHGLRMDRS